LLSIQHKLPMVVAGIHEGKNEINARVSHFKLGVNLNTEKPTPERIREAVEEVLARDGYRVNVQRLSEEFGRYNSRALCEKYVDELLRRDARREEPAAL
jgi:UDP:flavonoid glycosyltransferase YjiC (YdhE family)